MTSTTTSPVLHFGKHKGSTLNSVPTGYLRWLLDSTVAVRYSLEKSVMDELTTRGEGSAIGGYISKKTSLPPIAAGLYDPGGSFMPTTGGLSMGTITTTSTAPTLGGLMGSMGFSGYSPAVKAPAVKKSVKEDKPSKTKRPRMNCWTLATDVLASGFHVLLHGGIGLGKTTFALQAGLTGSEPLPQGLTLTDGMTLGDMFGRFWLKSGTSEWIDGPATRALRAGSRLVLNEVESASGEIMTALHALTDHPTIARVALPNGEILTPAPGFRVVMTSNFIPAESLPAPLVDRAISIEIDSPHPDSVMALPEDLRQAARSSCIQKDAKRRVSMRAWHHFAALRRSIGEEAASQAVFAGRSDDILDAFAIRRGPRD